MDKSGAIREEAEELLSKMISRSEVSVEETEGVYQVLITAEEDAPTVIGRHGETIRAIQKILEVMMYKKFGEPVELLVNVNDYRQKQKERLEGIAERIAQEVKTTKQAVPLRSFSSYERKLIHEYIAKNHPDLTSYSEGEGKERQLMIAVKKEDEIS